MTSPDERDGTGSAMARTSDDRELSPVDRAVAVTRSQHWWNAELLGFVRTSLTNPFFLYAIMWAFVLLLYSLGWSNLYGPLDPRLLWFFLLSIAASVGLGLRLRRWINLAYRPAVDDGVVRSSLTVTGAIVVMFAVDFAYARHVPLVEAVRHSGYLYSDFVGIPTVHVLLITFSTFFIVFLTHLALHAAGSRRFVLLAEVLVLLLMYLLLLNRGAITISVVMAGLVCVSSLRLRVSHAVIGLLLVLLGLFVFGGLGNQRTGAAFSDNSSIVAYAQVSDQFPAFVPHQFLWGYMYLVSPLGNLNTAVSSLTPTADHWSLVVNVIPDFISKRLFPGFDPSTPLSAEYFNVSTGFASAWKFYGGLGLAFTFCVMAGVIYGSTRLARAPYMSTTLAIMGGVVVFMFFTNTLSYSGISFALVYPLALSHVGHRNWIPPVFRLTENLSRIETAAAVATVDSLDSLETPADTVTVDPEN
jgi:hypothetical protein